MLVVKPCSRSTRLPLAHSLLLEGSFGLMRNFGSENLQGFQRKQDLVKPKVQHVACGGAPKSGIDVPYLVVLVYNLSRVLDGF